MLPKELLKKIRRIEVRTNKAVTNIMAGDYKSAFRGAGMEFDELREYQVGDDIRSIDWNVTARQGRPFIKRFHEERELTVFFLVDASASGLYGSHSETKTDLAAQLCATLAFNAVRSNDKVGLLLFTGKIERFIPPAKGINHAMRIVTEVLGFKSEDRGTDLGGAIDYIGRALHKKAVIFILSDYLTAQDYSKPLQRLAQRHDVVALPLLDDSDALPPAIGGLLTVSDAETGEEMLIDPSSPAVVNAYQCSYQHQQASRTQLMRRLGVDELALHTGEDFGAALTTFLRKRQKY